MPIEIYTKKLSQISSLLSELERLLSTPLDLFLKDTLIQRATERDFQLIINLAVDINSYLIAEKTGKSPETYRKSFLLLSNLDILNTQESEALANAAELRNVLVHDYDFDTDTELFYSSAKESLPSLRSYLSKLLKLLIGNKNNV